MKKLYKGFQNRGYHYKKRKVTNSTLKLFYENKFFKILKEEFDLKFCFKSNIFTEHAIQVVHKVWIGFN